MNIRLDAAQLATAGLDCQRDGDQAVFRRVDPKGRVEPHWFASAQLVGEEMVFYPLRSAGHREVLKRLGLGPAG